eukprot:8534536-Pyramimonas_sp.AAC.1
MLSLAQRRFLAAPAAMTSRVKMIRIATGAMVRRVPSMMMIGTGTATCRFSPTPASQTMVAKRRG